MDMSSVLKEMGVNTNSPNVAIVAVAEHFENSRCATTAANELIQKLGGARQETPIEADIIAKALAEQVVVQREQFNPEEAMAIAMEKLLNIKERMPYLFKHQEQESEGFPAVNDTSKPGLVKRNKAAKTARTDSIDVMVKEITDTGERDRGVIVTKIAAQVNMEYANVYYYVKKAEKAHGLVFTAQKGRKSGKKNDANPEQTEPV